MDKYYDTSNIKIINEFIKKLFNITRLKHYQVNTNSI